MDVSCAAKIMNHCPHSMPTKTDTPYTMAKGMLIWSLLVLDRYHAWPNTAKGIALME